jgi:hypothetical protein
VKKKKKGTQSQISKDSYKTPLRLKSGLLLLLDDRYNTSPIRSKFGHLNQIQNNGKEKGQQGDMDAISIP